MTVPFWAWAAVLGVILLMLAVDLFAHRKAHVVGVREALAWTAVWMGLDWAFGAFVYFGYENHWLGLGADIDAVDGRLNDGASATLKYLTGYVVEKSLSVDNVFVIAMLFAFFAVPQVYQHRVLFWGILGALVMRGIMIWLGVELLHRFNWMFYVLGEDELRKNEKLVDLIARCLHQALTTAVYEESAWLKRERSL